MQIKDGNGKTLATHPAHWWDAFVKASPGARQTLVKAVPKGPLSGSWRSPLVKALRMAEENGAKSIRGKLARAVERVDPASVYDPGAVRRCSTCGRLGHTERDFGPRMDRRVKVPEGMDPETLAADIAATAGTVAHKVGILPDGRIFAPRPQNACRVCRKHHAGPTRWVPAAGRKGARLPTEVGEPPAGAYCGPKGTPWVRADGVLLPAHPKYKGE